MKTIIRNAALQKTAFFVSLPGYKNKKRVTAVTQYLVNLKSNTMKNTMQRYGLLGIMQVLCAFTCAL